MQFLNLITLMVFCCSSISCVIAFAQQAKCPSYGNHEYTCTSHDYCNKTLGLVCGDGYCGIGECPPGWSPYNNICYFRVIEMRSFSEAESICSSQRAKIITFKTKQDIINIGFGGYFWLSARASNHLEFTWPDGTKLLNNDSLWASNEPDNSHHEQNEYCSYISESFTAHDVPCDSTAYVVCEIEKTCLQSKCGCQKNYYFDSVLNRCVFYKTLNDPCAHYDYEPKCNPNKGLEFIDGQCLCPDKHKWNNFMQKCERCPISQVTFNNECFLVNKIEREYHEADKMCQLSGMKLITPSTNDKTRLRDLIEPYNKYLNKRSFGVWVNAIETIKKYGHQNNLYCGGNLQFISNDPCLFINLKENYCIDHAPCSQTVYFSICEY